MISPHQSAAVSGEFDQSSCSQERMLLKGNCCIEIRKWSDWLASALPNEGVKDMHYAKPS